MRNAVGVALLFLFSWIPCVGQKSYAELTSGKSTKADVERTFGQPVREISETLFQYKSDKATKKVFVQYGIESAVIERIEATYSEAVERSDMLRALNLPPQPTASQTNSKDRLEEYFATAAVVLTYAGAEITSGVSRVGYYSRELFESAAAKVPRGPTAANNNPNNPPPPQPSLPKYEDVIAIARGALQARDFQNALRLGQAVSIDAAKPEAYEIIGITQLYGMGNAGAAEAAYRAALERGGKASFSATHDHDGFFQAYCQGTFALSRLGVAYFANDGSHQFNVILKDMREAGMNKLIGGKFAAFHVKVLEDPDDLFGSALTGWRGNRYLTTSLKSLSIRANF